MTFTIIAIVVMLCLSFAAWVGMHQQLLAYGIFFLVVTGMVGGAIWAFQDNMWYDVLLWTVTVLALYHISLLLWDFTYQRPTYMKAREACYFLELIAGGLLLWSAKDGMTVAAFALFTALMGFVVGVISLFMQSEYQEQNRRIENMRRRNA